MRGWVALVALGVVAAVIGSAASAQTAPNVRALQGVNFVSACGFSHRLPDDPIVHPKHAGMSHDHSFVGNTTTNAFSTRPSLLKGSSTCRRPGDTAAYWMPTLLQNGQPVEPLGATIYYRRRTLDPVRAFPPGLKMIAGDATATAPQDRRVTFWNCGAATGMPPSATVPACPDGRTSGLRLHVTFPSCWNGTQRDSADHQSHMAYPMRGRCPATHPVVVPAISLIYRYPITGGPGVTLASGSQYSAHADFFNAWRQPALSALVNGCLNALRHCGRGS
jgi:Domain of unknown function (DUF1996)